MVSLNQLSARESNQMFKVLFPPKTKYKVIVIVYHVTIVANDHGLLKKFWPLVIG